MSSSLTLDQIRLAGLDALARELGPVGMVRFLQQFETGRGDYSAERHEWLSGRTVREFVSELRRQRPASGAVQGRNSVSDASP